MSISQSSNSLLSSYIYIHQRKPLPDTNDEAQLHRSCGRIVSKLISTLYDLSWTNMFTNKISIKEKSFLVCDSNLIHGNPQQSNGKKATDIRGTFKFLNTQTKNNITKSNMGRRVGESDFRPLLCSRSVIPLNQHPRAWRKTASKRVSIRI